MDPLRLDVTVPLRHFSVDVDLVVGAETLALVGPSGAGKTTVLRAVAGLLRPSRGRIALGQETWFDADARTNRPPEERNVGLVFQHYALFPHLTVRANVGYARSGRTDELLARFGLSHLARARPRELSGGERQRVALARALARDPEVLLLDEPLSALDPHTRVSVRSELARMLEGLELPTLIVTHDFRDARALAGRVAVMRAGSVVQIATPDELVAAPADAFVASLVAPGDGTPARS